MKKRSPFWIGFIAFRYIGRGRKNSPTPVLSILGIATGVLALTVILAVMNGFQLGFIESILEVSSYHIRVEGFPADEADTLADAAASVPGVLAAFPFSEFQGLLRGKRYGQQAVVVRGLPAGILQRDQGMVAHLEFEDGVFDVSGKDDIVLGAELARRIGAVPGDQIQIFAIPSLFSGGSEDSASQWFTVKGIFRTGFYEYDMSWALVNIAAAEQFSGGTVQLGVKIADRFADRKELALIKETCGALNGAANFSYSSWRDYNRAFFGALRTEKLFMFILVGLIFIVVGLNIFQAQRRTVLERREEIGLLRAVGAGRNAVRLIFVWDGFLIGVTGASIGMILGLAIANNIGPFFSGLETIVNVIVDAANYFAGLLGGRQAGSFAVFSPTIFYLKEIPSRVIPREAALIYCFGFFSALAASWFASGKASRTNPAEVLRYE